MIKIIWSDDFPSSEMAELIRDKFDISVSYFEEDYDFGVKIADWDYNSKILNFIKKKVGDVSIIEESKKSVRKSMKETRNSSQTVGELLQNATLKTKVYIYVENTHDEFEGLVDSLFNDSAYVKFLNYESYAWYINKNIMNIYCI